MSDAAAVLPPAGRERLAEAAKEGCFTSDLTVDEWVLVRQAGFEPLGMVLGSSMYHVGIQIARWKESTELNVLTQAMYSGRELALARMTAEAEELGADGIVGVDLTLVMYAGGQEVMEFLAVGTAVKGDGSLRAPGGRPFSSKLSGVDFYKLVSSGFVPTSLVLGCCVYHVAHQSAMQSLRQVGLNVEMPLYTQAVYEARELAMKRMQDEGRRSGGTGMVGVSLTHANHVWGEHAIEFLAVGTAVRPCKAGQALGKVSPVLPFAGA